MDTQVKHTPTPWMADGSTILASGGVQPHIAYLRETGGLPLTDNAEENAAFIVRACNAHDALVEALQFVHHDVTKSTEGHTLNEHTKALVERALAKAEGK